MKPLAIFKPGKHTALNGMELEFSAADVAATAAAYDQTKHKAPLVIGHPKTDTPAYGWVDSLYFSNGLLNAYADAVTAEFAGWISDGFYKKMSSSFYPPGHPGNPVPGVYYLRHIGFLGGCPPAVKGLPDAAFSEQDGLVSIDFSENKLPLTKDTYQIAMEARAYHAKQSALGINISFSEAVDTINAMGSENRPITKPSEFEIARAVRAYHAKQSVLGINISFSKAVDAVTAILF